MTLDEKCAPELFEEDELPELITALERNLGLVALRVRTVATLNPRGRGTTLWRDPMISRPWPGYSEGTQSITMVRRVSRPSSFCMGLRMLLGK